jgi:hypothetical protein
MMLITRSANCTGAIWAEAAPKKKNVKTATGVIVVMPRRKQRAEITKISHNAFIELFVPKEQKK